MFSCFADLTLKLQSRLSGLPTRWKAALAELAGWATFLTVCAWFYRIPPWMWSTHATQAIKWGDPLEALWQIELWRQAVLTGQFGLVTLSGMYPLGLHHMTIAHAGTGLLLLPFSLALGSAVALNLGLVGGLVFCFLGARRFLRHITTSAFLSSVGATIFTFALGRTVHVTSHLHVALASSFGIWMASLLLDLRSRAHDRSAWKYAIASGLMWGAAVIAQSYAIFWGMLLLLLLGKTWRAWKYVPLVGVSAFVVSALFLLGLAQGTAYLSSIGPSLHEVVSYRSIPSYFVGWSAISNWEQLRDLSSPWKSRISESGMQNWGIIVVVLVAIGVVTAPRYARTLLALLAVSLTLSFGPLWVDPPLKSDIATQINNRIWQLGRRLKPDLFNADTDSLQSRSLLLPSMALYILVPRYEFARVPGRYSLWVSLSATAIAVAVLSRLPVRWAVLISYLWILELLPSPRHPVAIPTQPHPAHTWAATRLEALGDDRAVHSPSGAYYIYSHHLAGQLPGTQGLGSFVPSHMRYLQPWNPSLHYPLDPAIETLTDPAQVAILRRAQVGILLLSQHAASIARQNSALRFMRCFEPDSTAQVYAPDPLCAFEVLPNQDDFFTIQPVSGFSLFEPNFVWIEGTKAKAGWRISRPTTQTLQIALRAYCPPQGRQSVLIKLNGQPIASHTWFGNCWERWEIEHTVPPAQLNAGWNSLEFEATSTAQPYMHEANNPDSRNLSVGVERLVVVK